MGGTLVFRGTRVPAQSLLDYLDDHYTLDEFLDMFPSVRRDGTFSFRFALPDGNYDLPVQATSADASDSRRAELRFSRATQYRGEVGAHPQDAALKVPRVENVG